jgi:hypothetical protein
MLPRVLCEHLCSLNPGEVWKLHNCTEPMIINTVYSNRINCLFLLYGT